MPEYPAGEIGNLRYKEINGASWQTLKTFSYDLTVQENFTKELKFLVKDVSRNCGPWESTVYTIAAPAELLFLSDPDDATSEASVTDASCFDGDDGEIHFWVSGGEGAYSFTFNNTEIAPTE